MTASNHLHDRAEARPTHPLLRAAIGFAVLGCAVGIISAAFPIGFDEAERLAVARKMVLGDVLYRDVINNKPPPIYGVVVLLDILPGTYESARSVFLAFASFLSGFIAYSIATELGTFPPRAVLAGSLVAFIAALQAGFLLTVELVALIPLLLAAWAVARGRIVAGGVLGAFAAMTDLRAAVMLLALYALAVSLRGSRSGVQLLLTGGALIAVFWTTVITIPTLRFSLIDLNFASRVGTGTDYLATLAGHLRAALPIVGSVIAVGATTIGALRADARRTGVALLTLLLGAAIAVVSMLPYDHYWAFSLIGIPIAASAFPPSISHSRSALLILPVVLTAFIPQAIHSATTQRAQITEDAHYKTVSDVLGRYLADNETFVQFDHHPFLPALRPSQFAGRSPVLGFVTAPSARALVEIDLLAKATATSSAIIDDSDALDAEAAAIKADHLGVWRMFRAQLDGFECQVPVDGTVIRLRAEICERTQLPDTHPVQEEPGTG